LLALPTFSVADWTIPFRASEYLFKEGNKVPNVDEWFLRPEWLRIPFRASMSEKYTYIEPIKKGIQITELVTKTVYKSVKPRLETHLARGIAKLLKAT